jgi:hypothetical protein
MEVEKGNRPKNKYEWKKWKLTGDTRYFEFHHVIPKCFGGNCSKKNLIPLTGREHFLAHYLLTKIYYFDKKKYFQMLNSHQRQCKNTKGIIYVNSSLYEKTMKELVKIRHLQIGTFTGKKHTEETKEKMKKIWKERLLKDDYVSPRKGIPLKLETKEKLSKTKKELYKSGKLLPSRRKKVICLNTLKIYNSVEEARKEYKIYSVSNITKAILVKSFSGGVFWDWYEEGKNYTKIEKTGKITVPVKNIDTGEKFNSISEAIRKYPKSIKISEVIYGKRSKAGGFHWEIITK